jgi:hypothetical protein
VFARVPWKGIPALYMTDAERLTWWEHNVYWALRTADEYVWLYSEKMNWWTDEGLPQGMEQAIVSAREKIAAAKPLGFDLREMMATVEQRREAAVAATLIRRTAAIPALGAVPAPAIDGDLGDAAWAAAAALEPFVGIFGTAPEELKAATRALVAYDRSSLYLALRCDEPEPARMHVVGAQHDDGVWAGDSVDIFLSTAPSGKPYVHFILNPRNVRWDAAYATDNDMGYDPAWQSATRIGTSGWTVEVAIPWTALQVSPEAGQELRLNLCRNRHWANELSSWSQVLRGFMEPAHFGTWTLR